MSEENLRWLAGQLTEKFKDADDYARWFTSGLEAIVINSQAPSTAFSPGKYIIGIYEFSLGAPQWRDDIKTIYQALPQEHQAFLDAGLAQSLAAVPAEPDQNDPFRNGQCNFERLAITFLSLARTLKSRPCRDVLDAVETNFSSSEAVRLNIELTKRLIPGS